MPETQPGKPVLRQPESPPEAVVAEWTEPTESLEQDGRLPLLIVIVGGLLIAVGLLALGLWLHDFTYYLGTAAILAAVAAITSQRRRPAAPRDIILSTQSLHVGRQSYALSELAGFWLEPVGEAMAVNVEPKKAAMLPITFLYPSPHLDETRQTLLEVLPELEPRRSTAADSLNRYIRL